MASSVSQGEILMQDSVRDAFMVALKSMGYSMNTENPEELAQARDLLTVSYTHLAVLFPRLWNKRLPHYPLHWYNIRTFHLATGAGRRPPSGCRLPSCLLYTSLICRIP